VNTSSNVVVYDGTNKQTLTGTSVPASGATRFTVYSDYANTNWDLYVGNVLATNGVGFYDTNAAALTDFGIISGSGAGADTSLVDSVALTLGGPSFLTPDGIFGVTNLTFAESAGTVAVTVQLSKVYLYDTVYEDLDYATHAAVVRDVIRARNPSADLLLDVACGTGRHLALFQDWFGEVAGVDIDPAMLEEARSRLPGVPFRVGDMTDFDLGRRFDAVTCLFSSIGYVRDEDGLHATMAAMARHLQPGGVLVVEPWLWPDMIQPPLVRIDVTERPDMVIARTSRMHIEGAVSHMEFAYLVTTEGGSETFTEDHVMGLFTPDQYLEAVAAAGLRAEFDRDGPMGRGLAIGVQPDA
jgi:SAM-dependent methyltransferase